MASGAWDNLSRPVALFPQSLRSPTPPQLRVPTPQRRRATARQRGAAGSARITGNIAFLAWPGLDRLGSTQAIGGLALGLIALFSSYDHLTIAGRTVAIPQQWGIPLIAASVAIIFVDAQLATGSRLRAEHEPQSVAIERSKERERSILRAKSCG